MPFLPKDGAVQEQAMQVQTLCLPLAITHNATSASVVVTVDNPSLLFVKTEGTNRITLADGAVDSAAELSAITYTSASDASGVTNILVRVNEQLSKVVSIKFFSRTSASLVKCGTLTSAPTTSITSAGDKIVCDLTHGVDLATTDLDGMLEVQYIAKQ